MKMNELLIRAKKELEGKELNIVQLSKRLKKLGYENILMIENLKNKLKYGNMIIVEEEDWEEYIKIDFIVKKKGILKITDIEKA